jgi:release factor glutamine methyltransferase
LAYGEIIAAAPAHLGAGGRLVVETGFSQGPAVASLFKQAGFGRIAIRQDLGGLDRVVTGTLL